MDAAVSNREQYRCGALAADFGGTGRFIDFGEQRALTLVAGSCRGVPILDIGVGAGRTTPLLRLLSNDYTGMDYSDALLQRAAAANPGVDFVQGDARNLSGFPREHYALIVFSFNGIDSVGHTDRAVVLREVWKALRPEGRFVYSTLNLRGPWFDAPPWRIARESKEHGLSKHLARLSCDLLRQRRDMGRRWLAYWKVRGQVQDMGDWAMGPMGGQGAGLVQHWSTPAATERELTEAGLELITTFNSDGSRLGSTSEDSTGGMFHLVARRAVAPADGR